MATWNSSLNRTAFSATLHCLTGCAIGEVRSHAEKATPSSTSTTNIEAVLGS
jgi:hypothetical protein